MIWLPRQSKLPSEAERSLAITMRPHPWSTAVIAAMHETIAAPVTASSDLSIDIEIATLALNEQQRRVIRGVFTDEAMGGIAAVLGVTPSRVTRIKTAAFAKMAAVLEEYAPTKSNTEPSTPH